MKELTTIEEFKKLINLFDDNNNKIELSDLEISEIIINLSDFFKGFNKYLYFTDFLFYFSEIYKIKEIFKNIKYIHIYEKDSENYNITYLPPDDLHINISIEKAKEPNNYDLTDFYFYFNETFKNHLLEQALNIKKINSIKKEIKDSLKIESNNTTIKKKMKI